MTRAFAQNSSSARTGVPAARVQTPTNRPCRLAPGCFGCTSPSPPILLPPSTPSPRRNPARRSSGARAGPPGGARRATRKSRRKGFRGRQPPRPQRPSGLQWGGGGGGSPTGSRGGASSVRPRSTRARSLPWSGPGLPCASGPSPGPPWALLAGALRGAAQRPAPHAPGQNERPAPRAPERPGPGHDARVIRRQGPAWARSPQAAQPGSAQPACSTLMLNSLKKELLLHARCRRTSCFDSLDDRAAARPC